MRGYNMQITDENVNMNDWTQKVEVTIYIKIWHLPNYDSRFGCKYVAE